jgi:polysaccharide biosynthesis protein PelF
MLQRSGDVAFRLDVMGHDHETPDYAAECKRRCTELGLDDVVKFVGNQNLREVLADYDLLVLPSYNEGQPLVVLEAMTIGLPVVGSRVGGMAHLVEDPLIDQGDSCGVLVQPGDPEALAHALYSVLSEPRMYQNLQANARRRVLARFRLEQAMSTYRKTYSHVARGTFFPAPTGDRSGALAHRSGEHRRGVHRRDGGGGVRRNLSSSPTARAR